MIRIVRVTNPIDPSRDKVISEIEAGGHLPLDHILRGHHVHADDGDAETFEVWAQTVVVSVNGHVWPRSIWTEITPKDGDCIVVAPLVQGGGVWRTLATIAVIAASAALVASGAGAALGGMLMGTALSTTSAAMATAMLAGAASVAGNLLVSAFLGPSQPSNKTGSASYDPDGPQSLAQSGVVIPKGYGTFMWGGNIISSFTEIAGADYFLNVLVCFGFGPARSITGIEINGKVISSYQNCQYYTRLGSNTQTEIGQFNQVSNGYPQDTQCLAGIPVVVPGTGDLTQALQVDIQFPDGVFVDTGDGNLIPAIVTYLVEYSVSGENNWQPVLQPQTTQPVTATNPDGSLYLPYSWGVMATDLPASSNVVYNRDDGPHTPGDPWTGTLSVETYDPNGNHTTYNKVCTGEWQLLDINMNYVEVLTWSAGYIVFSADQTTPCYNRTQILGLAPNKYDVQITKWGSGRLHSNATYGDNWSPTIGQDMWVHSVNEITYLDLAYPNLILLGVRALATSQLSGSNINVTAIIEHGLRSKDEGLQPPELAAYEEDNPACVAADMMIDDLYGGGAWPGIQAANLERFIDEWVAWAELNDTLVPDGNGNSIRLNVFNGIFDNESDLWSQLGVVTAMSRACLVPMGTDYGVSLDDTVDAPVQMFSVGNILQDSFNETWLPIDDRTNQVEVQFADSTRYYREDNPMVYMDPANMDAGVVVKNTRIRGKGITIPAQAWHFARYKERGNLLLRTGSFRTDTDGIACRPFNVIALQHDVPQWGYGGRTLPGSTASVLLLDRNDLPFAAGTSYTAMVQHPDVARLSLTPVTAVATSTSPPGYTLTVPAWANTARITRAVINGNDCSVLVANVGSIIVSPPPGFVPATGQAVSLYDTDVLETAAVTAVEITGDTAQVTLGTPLSRAPQEYSNYIYGVSGATKLVRVTGIRKAGEFRSTLDYIDYDPDVYDIATPIIGETSAITVTNPGVTSLEGSETFQKVGGTYVSFASLSWVNGPDTVGVGIYAMNVGGTGLPQMVARVPNATSWQAQQAVGANVQYIVVGYDVNDTYANFTTAPSVTIDAVGIADNLLYGSSFETGFTYWSITPRTGDAFVPTFDDDGQADYTVAGTALASATTFAFQGVLPSKWTVGDYLMLSGYIEDSCVSPSAPNSGEALLNLIFQNAAGAQTMTTATIALKGTSPTLTRINTAAVLIPAGTVAVFVSFGVGGTGLNLPVGSVVTISHLLLEVAVEGQTAPSAWADLDVQGQVLDIFTTGASTVLRAQGSILPSFTGQITYTSTSASITIAWTNLVILWPDGAYTQIQNGSLVFTNLAPSSTFWAFLYFDIVYGGVVAAIPMTPIGTPAELSALYDATADAACKQDNRVPLTAGGLQMTTPASGGSGSGGTNPVNPIDCTVRGTELQTPEGPLSNVEIAARFQAGEEVYLIGRRGPERIKHAYWVPITHFYLIDVAGFTSFGGSESLTLKPAGRLHRWCSRLANGTRIETTRGNRPVTITRVEEPEEVLHIELEGPSHEYLVEDGVWTHNLKMQNPP